MRSRPAAPSRAGDRDEPGRSRGPGGADRGRCRRLADGRRRRRGRADSSARPRPGPVGRARLPARRPTDAAIVVEICRRLDGIPLAIELAAARTQSMSAAEIIERSTSGSGSSTAAAASHSERQQTLQTASTGATSSSTSPSARCSIVRRCSPAASPSSAAERVVATDDIDPFDVLDLLDSLVVGRCWWPTSATAATRYRLLETIRQFGAERLEEVRRHRGRTHGAPHLVPGIHGRGIRAACAGSTARRGWHASTASSTIGVPGSRTRSNRTTSTRWPTSSARSRRWRCTARAPAARSRRPRQMRSPRSASPSTRRPRRSWHWRRTSNTSEPTTPARWRPPAGGPRRRTPPADRCRPFRGVSPSRPPSSGRTSRPRSTRPTSMCASDRTGGVRRRRGSQ